MLTILVLCSFSFIAGLIDSIVGGGGLVQLPALLVMLPGVPIPSLLGTNKLASLAGTSTAAIRYGVHVRMDWGLLVPATIAAFIFSYLGSRFVSYLDPRVSKPLILVLLLSVTGYISVMNTMGLVHAPRHSPARARWLAVPAGAALGFYDGFFGPGTGSFLIFLFVGVFGFDFLRASASAKLINVGTTLASVIYFATSNQIRYEIALPMAGCNVLGSIIGSRLAILKGNRFVRIFFLLVVSALIVKLAWDLYR